ncbi:MAG: ANL family adenylate-forming protein [bacterium]
MLKQFQNHAEREAIIWQEKSYTYHWLIEAVQHWQMELDRQNVYNHSVVSLEADFSPNAIAILLALLQKNCLVVPLVHYSSLKTFDKLDVSQAEHRIRMNEHDEVGLEHTGVIANHELYTQLRGLQHPGLVLFTSGSAGRFKAAVHDFEKLIDKFRLLRRPYRTLPFLLFDHIGGINTLLYVLSNGGCIVSIQDRTPDAVLQMIEKYQVQLLPATPTFLNLIFLSEAYKRYPVPSLELVTYGTEPMPEQTLLRFREIYPHVRLQQTYGLTEVGILRTKSKTSDSVWMKVGGEQFQTRVSDGMLEIKAESAMIGYLNAPSPFTEDGWFKTGDAVEVDGEYMKILGRQTEIITVNGENVYPAIVESVLQAFPNVEDAVVYGEENPLSGQIVCAEIKMKEPYDDKALRSELLQHCQNHLKPHEVPTRFKFIDTIYISERFKKFRNARLVGTE